MLKLCAGICGKRRKKSSGEEEEQCYVGSVPVQASGFNESEEETHLTENISRTSDSILDDMEAGPSVTQPLVYSAPFSKDGSREKNLLAELHDAITITHGAVHEDVVQRDGSRQAQSALKLITQNAHEVPVVRLREISATQSTTQHELESYSLSAILDEHPLETVKEETIVEDNKQATGGAILKNKAEEKMGILLQHNSVKQTALEDSKNDSVMEAELDKLSVASKSFYFAESNREEKEEEYIWNINDGGVEAIEFAGLKREDVIDGTILDIIQSTATGNAQGSKISIVLLGDETVAKVPTAVTDKTLLAKIVGNATSSRESDQITATRSWESAQIIATIVQELSAINEESGNKKSRGLDDQQSPPAACELSAMNEESGNKSSHSLDEQQSPPAACGLEATDEGVHISVPTAEHFLGGARASNKGLAAIGEFNEEEGSHAANDRQSQLAEHASTDFEMADETVRGERSAAENGQRGDAAIHVEDSCYGDLMCCI